MLVVLKRLPIFPLIASSVTVVFGILTLVTHNPFWVQFKVTIFNALVALLLWIGMRSGHNFFRFVFGVTPAGEFRWAYSHPRVELVASEHAGAEEHGPAVQTGHCAGAGTTGRRGCRSGRPAWSARCRRR